MMILVIMLVVISRHGSQAEDSVSCVLKISISPSSRSLSASQKLLEERSARCATHPRGTLTIKKITDCVLSRYETQQIERFKIENIKRSEKPCYHNKTPTRQNWYPGFGDFRRRSCLCSIFTFTFTFTLDGSGIFGNGVNFGLLGSPLTFFRNFVLFLGHLLLTVFHSEDQLVKVVCDLILRITLTLITSWA